MINLREDAPDQVNAIDPSELSEAIEKLKSIGAQVSEAESKLKELKEQEKYINNFTIPEIMNKLNLSTVKLKDGSELSIKKVYSATIKADKKAEAIQWLRNNGLGDIVKNEITVNFGQGEENKAVAYVTLAKGQGYEPSQKEAVHPSTLKVTMEDWKNKGNDVPEDLFWTFDGNQTKIKNKR
jgi:hypothetical protein|tara:strand:+ start:1727 stop:2272 length:546 start_codon:yes stop_codon:yes gene_type:complete